MSATVFPLNSGEKTIAIIVGVAACISVASIVALSARVAIAAIRPIAQGLKGRKDSREALFFRTQLGAYVTSLLLANLLAGMAGFFEFSWASSGEITTGSECTAQGSLIQIGDFAGAYFTSVIAMHTFFSLVLHKRSYPWMVYVTIAFGWGSAIALGTAITSVSTSRHGPFFSSVGMWCAISSGYTIEQFVIYYLPIILSALVTTLLYSLIYLCLRGTLVIGGGIKLNLSPENVHGWAGRLNEREEYRYFLGSIIRSLLWFPFAYVVLFLPITIAGLMRISGITNSDGLLALAGVTASLDGFANVLILCNIMRVLRPVINSTTASTASESFVVGEERKQSPIEAPKPMPFEQKVPSPVSSATARSVQHGRAFPPPVSRVGTPLSATSSVYGLPATPRSGRPPLPRRSEEPNEHTPTAEMREMWLRHQRSSSSVDSTTTLLRAGSVLRMGHSRNPSSSASSENIHTLIGKPILPCSEISRRVDAEMMSPAVRSQTGSPAPVITITRPATPSPTTPMSAGLPPPPRRSRSESIRESLMSVNAKLIEASPPVPPVPPVSSVPPLPSADRSPDSVYTQPGTLHEGADSSDHRPGTPKTPMTSRSRTYSTRTSMTIDHEDFEIQRVESRERLRPAISAVARVPRPPSPPAEATQSFPRKNDMGMGSAVSLPESVGNVSMLTGESEDSLHAEIRSRKNSDEESEGALSSIAWASLVAHAAVQDRLTGEAALQSPVRSDTWDDDHDERDSFVFPQRPRRLSDVPMVLRPGTPESVGANMYFGFNTLAYANQSQKDDSEAGNVGNMQMNGASKVSRPVPAAMLRQVRSFNATGASATTSNSNDQLERSDTIRPRRQGPPPGYI